MLKVYHSNYLNKLKTIIELIIEQNRLNNPFEPEIIIVQNTNIAQWLNLSFSQKFGIAANIKFPLPANFIWNIFTRVLSGIPEHSALNKQAICWKVMKLLPDMLKYKEFSMLNYYLSNDSNKQKLFQLALRIANLYNRYMIYRPYWLISWEEDRKIEEIPKEHTWQALLWKYLIKYTKQLGQQHWHYANLYQRFIDTIKNTLSLQQKLPTRVFIYGVSTLPLLYLKILRSLSKYIDIHIFFMNPCRYYYNDADISSWTGKTLIDQYNSLEFQYNPYLLKNNNSFFKIQVHDNIQQIVNKRTIQNIHNPLLISWSKIGCDYAYMLSNISSSEENINAFVHTAPGCLLQNLQHDIFNQENNAIIGVTDTELSSSKIKKYQLNPEDDSVIIHVCHSIQREVEILHDKLLEMLESNINLKMRDIIVMVNDIDRYAPFIQAVFNSVTNKNYLPYAIANYSKQQTNTILQTFITLLSLLDSRFTSEDVLNLLNIPEIAMRFNIDKESLCYLRQWIEESGIRWGIDDNHIQEFKLPITGQYTWQFGLTRMLLGYAMETSQGEWNKVLPYDESNGLIAESIGYLASLITQLNSWHYKLQQEQTLEMWKPICRDILNDFFILNEKTEIEIAVIQYQWYTIIREGMDSFYDKLIPFSLLRDKIISRLTQKNTTDYCLDEVINIYPLMSKQSSTPIPFKVICLLGINGGSYPRTDDPISFDLMNLKPQCGDRNYCNDDRYFFLESLISAQQKLYISYIGRSMHDNKELIPSILVQELLDYICQSHYLSGDETLNCDDSAQRVRNHIVVLHSRMPFDPINYSQKEQQSYALEWLPRVTKVASCNSFLDTMLDDLPINTLSFEQLLRFWIHPVRSFFQMRLHIDLDPKINKIPDTEPFVLDDLNRYKLNQQLLKALIKEDKQELFYCYQAAAKLPYGIFGKIIWDIQYEEMQEIANKVIKYRQESYNQEIDLKCNGIQLTGYLRHVQSNGLLRWHPTILNHTHTMQLWIEHLVYCASGGTKKSRLFFRKNNEWCYLPLLREQALYYLSQIIEGYKLGMRKPLLFLPESGGAWIKTCYNEHNHNLLTDDITLENARIQFLKVYTGNKIFRGEGNNVWYSKLWRTLKPEYFDAIIQEAKLYLMPLYKFKINKTLD